MRNAVRKALVTCYSVEGFYPKNIEYLEDHYAVLIDKNYIVDYFLSQAFSSYFFDVVNFSRMQIIKRTKDFNLYLRHKGCYYNSDEIAEFAFSKGFKAVQRNVILTKDFLNVERESLMVQNARIIFNDATPAFQVR